MESFHDSIKKLIITPKTIQLKNSSISCLWKRKFVIVFIILQRKLDLKYFQRFIGLKFSYKYWKYLKDFQWKTFLRKVKMRKLKTLTPTFFGIQLFFRHDYEIFLMSQPVSSPIKCTAFCKGERIYGNHFCALGYA